MAFARRFLMSLAGLALIATPVLAGADLPEGAGNTIGTSCGDATSVTLISGENSWELGTQQTRAIAYEGKTEWGFSCEFESGKSKVSTQCYNAGYVLAIRSGGTLNLGCYDGDIPAELK